MEIKKFRSEYKLELIPASHEGISPGDLVWDPLLGPPDFSRKGMPNTIYTAFLDAGLIGQEEWEDFRKESLACAFMDAHFATRNVEVNVEYVQEFQHPTVGLINSEFHTEKLSKFSFSKLQVREMNNLVRIRIDQFLETMKAQHWKSYDGHIRRVYMITELYYGSIRMVVDKKYSPELEAGLRKASIDASGKIEGSHAVEYEFAHDNVPFAMRIERVRSFNG